MVGATEAKQNNLKDPISREISRVVRRAITARSASNLLFHLSFGKYATQRTGQNKIEIPRLGSTPWN